MISAHYSISRSLALPLPTLPTCSILYHQLTTKVIRTYGYLVGEQRDQIESFTLISVMSVDDVSANARSSSVSFLCVLESILTVFFINGWVTLVTASLLSHFQRRCFLILRGKHKHQVIVTRVCTLCRPFRKSSGFRCLPLITTSIVLYRPCPAGICRISDKLDSRATALESKLVSI